MSSLFPSETPPLPDQFGPAEQPEPRQLQPGGANLTVSIVDVAHGRDVDGVQVCLQRRIAGEWRDEALESTDEGGLARLLAPHGLARGVYRVEFDVDSYFAGLGKAAFHPTVVVVFRVTDPDRLHHIPIMITPYSHSTHHSMHR